MQVVHIVRIPSFVCFISVLCITYLVSNDMFAYQRYAQRP